MSRKYQKLESKESEGLKCNHDKCNHDKCNHAKCDHDECRDKNKKYVIILKEKAINDIIQAPGPNTPGFLLHKRLNSSISFVLDVNNPEVADLILNIGGWTVLAPIGGTIVYYNDGNFNENTGEYTVPVSGGWMINVSLNTSVSFTSFSCDPNQLPPYIIYRVVLLANGNVIGSSNNVNISNRDLNTFNSQYITNLRATLAAGQIVRLAFIVNASIGTCTGVSGPVITFDNTEGTNIFSMNRIP